MADEPLITTPTPDNTPDTNVADSKLDKDPALVVLELSAHLRQMESHLATLSNLARVAAKAQTRAMSTMERNVDALLTMIKLGRRKALNHLPQHAE